LLKKDLKLIEKLVLGAQIAQHRIQLNLLISALYNITTIALVLQGMIGPIACAIFMPLSSLSVAALSNKKIF
jgi:Cu+-exporting ATPase